MHVLEDVFQEDVLHKSLPDIWEHNSLCHWDPSLGKENLGSNLRPLFDDICKVHVKIKQEHYEKISRSFTSKHVI